MPTLACSKRSDSRERYGVKKAMKSRVGLGREVRVPSLTSPPPSLLFFRAPFYFAPLPIIWTPGTGYAHINKVKVIRKYMSSTLTEIFTSQKTLGQCTVQIFAKSLNKWRKKPTVRASTLPLVWNSRKRTWKSAGVIQMSGTNVL